MRKWYNAIVLLLIFSVLYSCNQEEIKSFEKQIATLKSKNDSLQNSLTAISKKYVFDSIIIYNRPDCDNTFKLGSNYKKTFIISAYNKSDFLIKYDTIIDGEMTNMDTIRFKNGAYEYQSKIIEDNKRIKIKMQTGDKNYGNYMQGTLYDVIPIKN